MAKRAAILVLASTLGAAFGGGAPRDPELARLPAGTTLTADVSSAFVRRMVAQSSSDNEPLDDRILRADVHGRSLTTSGVDAEIVEDRENVSIDLVVRGTTVSDSIAWQGPAKLYTTARNPFVARRRMRVNADGVHADDPVIDVEGTLVLHQIANRRDRTFFPLAPLAHRLYRRSHDAANEQIKSNTRQRVRTRVEADAAPHLKTVQLGCQTVFELLTQIGRRPQAMRFSSDPARAGVAVQMPEHVRQVKLSMPPSLPAKWDVALRVHESMLTGLGQVTLAGKTFSLDRLESLGDEVHEWFQARLEPDRKRPAPIGVRGIVDKDVEEVSVTFAADPVRIAFGPGIVRVIVQTTNYRSGKQDYEGFRAEAVYRVEGRASGFTVVRDGRVKITGLGPSLQQATLTRAEIGFLRQAFESGGDHLELGDVKLAVGRNEEGILVPCAFSPQDDWLLIAWRWK